MQQEQFYRNLQTPSRRVDVVIDSDTFNEVDDQFAISYLLASADKLNLRAIYAAPFLNDHSVSAEDGMEKSYQEILTLLELAGKTEYIPCTYKGSDRFLRDENTPVESAAALDLVRRAQEYSPENPLYVVAIGAITNIASALILHPQIRENIVVIWLGGHGRDYHNIGEFNMRQDVAAARVVFRSGAPLVQLPCAGVVSALSVSMIELEHYLAGRNPLCDFLLRRVKARVGSDDAPVSRILWDVAAVSWLLNTNDRFMLARVDSLAIPEYNLQYSYDPGHKMQYVYYIKRDNILKDLFEKLATMQLGQTTQQRVVQITPCRFPEKARSEISET